MLRLISAGALCIRAGALPVWIILLVGCSASEPATSPPPQAGNISVLAGNEQTAAADGTLPESLAVVVRDHAMLPLPGVLVLWRVLRGTGRATPPSTMTGPGGVARTSFKVGTSAGTDSISAEVSGSNIAPVRFGAQVRAGPVAEVTLNVATLTLQVGRTQGLTASVRDAFGNVVTPTTLAWSSSDPAVAAVSPMGVVTAIKPGSVIITSTADGRSGTCTVTVAPGPVAQVSLQAARAVFLAGDTLTLVATARDSANNIVPSTVFAWTSSATSVASVSSAGVLTALTRGSATITVTANARAASLVVRVDERLGVVSELAPTMRPDDQVFYGLFSGGGATLSDFRSDSVTRMEGRESLRITISSSGGAFAGWFAAIGNSTTFAQESVIRDLSAFTGGSLQFWIRSTAAIDLEVGIRSNNVAPGAEFKVLLSQLPLTLNSEWRRACIPISLLTGQPPRADLGRLKIAVTFAVSPVSGNTGGVPVTLWFDDISYHTATCA